MSWLSKARRPNLMVLTGSLVLLGLFIPFALSVGQQSLSGLQVVNALMGQGSRLDSLLVVELRMPRVLMALMVGASLALAGFVLQNLTRVSLASPSLLGAVDGAGVGVLLFLCLSGESGGFGLVLAGFMGALASFSLVYFLTLRRSDSVTRFILVGISVAGIGKALMTLLMITGPVHLVSQAQLWLTGYINQTNWQEVSLLFPIFSVLVLALIACYAWLELNQLCKPLSSGLGLPNRAQFILVLLSCGLTAAAVSFAGALGFIGLIVPHLVRRLIPFGALSQLFACVILGGGLTLAADLAGRTVFPPYEIPAGIFTAILGVPLFLYLFVMPRKGL